jgi:hypothetical protein
MLQLQHKVKFKANSVSPYSGIGCTEKDSHAGHKSGKMLCVTLYQCSLSGFWGLLSQIFYENVAPLLL